MKDKKLNKLLDLITRSECRQIYYNLVKDYNFTNWEIFDAEFDSIWNNLSGEIDSSYQDTLDRSAFMDLMKIIENEIEVSQANLRRVLNQIKKNK